jgi:hypothetical protein
MPGDPDLQEEFAWTYGAPGPQLDNQIMRCAQLLVELHDAGGRVDAERTNRLVRSGQDVDWSSFGAQPMTQQEYDAWQMNQVERRDREGLDMTPPGGYEPGWWRR